MITKTQNILLCIAAGAFFIGGFAYYHKMERTSTSVRENMTPDAFVPTPVVDVVFVSKISIRKESEGTNAMQSWKRYVQ